jgi:hypothetical protein
MTGKQWKHEKCNTNTPPETVPSGPPTAQFGKKVGSIVDNVDLSTCRYYNNGNCDAAEGGSRWSPPCSHRCNWFIKQKLEFIEQKYNKLRLEAEDAPICSHYKEEPRIQQERDRYKEALDKIEECINNACATNPKSCYYSCSDCDRLSETELINKILGIINKAKDGE